jgi:zona occludens toxin
MISAYVGLPGSGKSYGVTEQLIIPALKEGRAVWTNIPINNEMCLEQFQCCPIQFDTDDIKENPRWWFDVFDAGALLVIDECWTLWPAGLKANNAREEDKEFINKHRHLTGNGFATEIVFVTQDLAQIASFDRALVETTYRAKKLTEVGADNRFKIHVYQGAVTGNLPPEKLLLQTLGPFKYKKKVYQLYQSQTMGDGQSSERRTDSRVNLLKSGNLKWYGVGAVASLFFISYAVGEVSSIFGGEPEPEASVQSTQFAVPVRAVIETPDYIEDFKKLVITNNNSILGYRFTLFNDYRAEFTLRDLRSMDITVQIINHCLARLSYKDNDLGFIGCQPDEISPDIFRGVKDFTS